MIGDPKNKFLITSDIGISQVEGCHLRQTTGLNLVASKAYSLPKNAHLPVIASWYLLRAHDLLGAVDQTEHIVKDEVASGTIGLQLEALGVVHGLLLLVNL